jgi:hypothetical protein
VVKRVWEEAIGGVWVGTPEEEEDGTGTVFRLCVEEKYKERGWVSASQVEFEMAGEGEGRRVVREVLGQGSCGSGSEAIGT